MTTIHMQMFIRMEIVQVGPAYVAARVPRCVNYRFIVQAFKFNYGGGIVPVRMFLSCVVTPGPGIDTTVLQY